MQGAQTNSSSKSYPKKLFYRINEVADIVGVQSYVLRYWETKFPMLRPERRGNDERRYRQEDVELLLRIRQLLHREKYTIAGAVERLERERSGRAKPEPAEAVEATDVDPMAIPGNEADQVRQQLQSVLSELKEIRDSID